MTNPHSIHILILLIITLFTTRQFLTTSSDDIIARTCLSCAQTTPSLSYNFCVMSLRSVPISHFVDLRGLALISMELALVNASDTISTVKGIIGSGSYEHDPIGIASLRDCLGLYEEAAEMILRGAGDFTAGEFESVGVLVSGVMEMCWECEDGFEKRGEVCPLKRENYDLFQLCDIALCIIVGNSSLVNGESVV